MVVSSTPSGGGGWFPAGQFSYWAMAEEQVDLRRLDMEAWTSTHMRRFFTSGTTLGSTFSGRANSVGFLRLAMALAVVASHSQPLGFNVIDPGDYRTGHQTHLGTVAVYGFFVMSGFLITRSATRTSIGRYVWHRALRILPGLWVCLLLIALVAGPLWAAHLHHSSASYWDVHNGPVSYLKHNFAGFLGQQGLSNLVLTHTQWGSLVNGSLWTLTYELMCYAGVAILAVTGVLKRARWVVPALAVVCLLYIIHGYLTVGPWRGPFPGPAVSIPVITDFSTTDAVPLALCFLLGASAQMYASKVPVSNLLAIVSLVLFGGSLLFGGFFLLGVPAFAYLMLWLAVRLPSPLHRVGRDNDFSYGVYIYAWPVQQTLTMLHLNRWGYTPYLLFGVVGTLALAIPSWFIVERNALRLKNWKPGRPAREKEPAESVPALESA